MLLDASLAAVVLIALVTDLLERKIHNALTIPAFTAGIVFHALFHSASSPWWDGLAGGFGLLLPFFALFAFGVMGSGDVKLLAAVGALGGVRVAIIAGLGVFFVHTFIGVARLLSAGRLGDVARALAPGWSPEKSSWAPWGLQIAIATLVALFLARLRAA